MMSRDIETKIPNPTIIDEFFIRSVLLNQFNTVGNTVHQDRTHLTSYDDTQGSSNLLNYHFTIGWSPNDFEGHFLDAFENSRDIPISFNSIDRYLKLDDPHPWIVKTIFNMLVTNDRSCPRVAADLLHQVVKKMNEHAETYGHESIARYYNDSIVSAIGNEHAKVFQSQLILDGALILQVQKYLIGLMDNTFCKRLLRDITQGIELSTTKIERHFIANNIRRFLHSNADTVNDHILCEEYHDQNLKKGFYRGIPDQLIDNVLVTISDKPLLYERFVEWIMQAPELENVGIDDLLREAASNHMLDGHVVRAAVDHTLMKKGVDKTQSLLIHHATKVLAQNPLNSNDNLNIAMINFCRAVHAFNRASSNVRPVMSTVINNLTVHFECMVNGSRKPDNKPPLCKYEPFDNLLRHLSLITQSPNKCVYTLEPNTGWALSLESLINRYNQSSLDHKNINIMPPGEELIQLHATQCIILEGKQQPEQSISTQDIERHTL